MLRKKRPLLIAAALCVLLILAVAGGWITLHERNSASESNHESSEIPNYSPDPSPSVLPSASPVPRETRAKITLSAVGDILIHDSVYKDAYKKGQGKTYHFDPMFARVKSLMEQADITFANQESIAGGAEIGLSSYPMFNSPFQISDTLQQAGVDIVSMANNHTLDRKEQAILNAIGYYEKIGLPYVGAYKDEEDRNKIRVLEKNGVKVAFLAFTYGTNGLTAPQGKEYLVNYIDKDRIRQEISKAKQQADVVVLSLHFGIEYQMNPNEEQKELAKFAVKKGADIILGHHPHVLQPAEWVEREDGTKGFVVYSLGNFLAAQKELDTLIGGILTLHIEKIERGDKISISIQNPSFIPTYISYKNWREYSVIPMDQLTNRDLQGIEQKREQVKGHMAKWMPDLAFPPSG